MMRANLMPKLCSNSMLLADDPAGSIVSTNGAEMRSIPMRRFSRRQPNHFFVLVLLAGFILPPGVGFADQTTPAARPRQRTHPAGIRSILDEKVSRFAKNFDLSEEQQSAVRQILEQQQQEILRIRRDPLLIGSAGIDSVRALQETTVARIRSILNEEQRKKYDPLAPRRIPQTFQPAVEDWLKAATPQ